MSARMQRVIVWSAVYAITIAVWFLLIRLAVGAM